MKNFIKKLYICLILISLLFINIDVTNVNAAPSWPSLPSGISVPSIVVMEATTGTVLMGKNINTKHYPASITKVLTTLLAIEHSPSSLNNTVTISQKSVDINSAQGGQCLPNTDAGDKLSMESALYGVMLRSANEVAYSVGETIAGSNAEFSKMMNTKAKSLGCKNSNFVNPNGLYADNHYTTAYDMALIGSAAIKYKSFREITKNKSYTIPETKTTVSTHHSLVENSSYSWCIGGKTGYTRLANHTLITFAKKNGMTLVCVVLDSPSASQAAQDTIDAVEYCYDNFSIYSIIKNEGKNISNELKDSQKYFKLNEKEQAVIYIDDNSSLVLPKGCKYSDATKSIEFYDNVQISNGANTIGRIIYKYGDRIIANCNITLNYVSSSLASLTLPEEMDSFNLLLDDTGSGNEISKITSIIIDILIIGIVISIILAFLLFIKNKFFVGKKHRSHRSRRRRKRGYL